MRQPSATSAPEEVTADGELRSSSWESEPGKYMRKRGWWVWACSTVFDAISQTTTEVARGSRGRPSTSLRHVTLTCALSHTIQHAMRALFANIHQKVPMTGVCFMFPIRGTQDMYLQHASTTCVFTCSMTLTIRISTLTSIYTMRIVAVKFFFCPQPRHPERFPALFTFSVTLALTVTATLT